MTSRRPVTANPTQHRENTHRHAIEAAAPAHRARQLADDARISRLCLVHRHSAVGLRQMRAARSPPQGSFPDVPRRCVRVVTRRPARPVARVSCRVASRCHRPCAGAKVANSRPRSQGGFGPAGSAAGLASTIVHGVDLSTAAMTYGSRQWRFGSAFDRLLAPSRCARSLWICCISLSASSRGIIIPIGKYGVQK